MNISSIKFKFISFNFIIVVITFVLIIAITTIYSRRVIIEERTESRKLVNNQAAFAAFTIVASEDNFSREIINEFMSDYPDHTYCVAISLGGTRLDYSSNNKDRVIYLKNEEEAREYEEYYDERPNETKIFPPKDGMLNIMSPVNGIDNEGKEVIVGYVLSGYRLDLLMDELKDVNKLLSLTISVILTLGILVAYFMTTLITKPIFNATDVIDNVAKGDFTRSVSIKSKSEIGVLVKTVNKMVTTWRSSIEMMKGVIDQTNASAENMSDNAKQQEDGTSEQASAINEVTTTVDELNSSSKQVYEKAEQVSKSSNDVLKIASEGQEAVEKSIEEINSIQGKVRAISEHTLNLSVEAQQIGSIVKTVSDISNKTDMLAINAGIEAARAGEHGKGFSIVATEVRELADQSQKSADKIAMLIENIQSATNSTVMSTEEAIKGFQVGIKLVLEAGQSIDNLIKHIQETVNYASEIALASRQQSVGTEQVASVMSTINEGMRTTANSAARILEEANNLKKLSNDLSGVANKYKTIK